MQVERRGRLRAEAARATLGLSLRFAPNDKNYFNIQYGGEERLWVGIQNDGELRVEDVRLVL